jgi:hypothetical protein
MLLGNRDLATLPSSPTSHNAGAITCSSISAVLRLASIASRIAISAATSSAASSASANAPAIAVILDSRGSSESFSRRWPICSLPAPYSQSQDPNTPTPHLHPTDHSIDPNDPTPPSTPPSARARVRSPPERSSGWRPPRRLLRSRSPPPPTTGSPRPASAALEDRPASGVADQRKSPRRPRASSRMARSPQLKPERDHDTAARPTRAAGRNNDAGSRDTVGRFTNAARGHPRSRLGRGPLVSPRAADGCIARVIREPVRATPTSPAALLLP